jgi:pimeloyl-ACP methyl ester carboxylesterase
MPAVVVPSPLAGGGSSRVFYREYGTGGDPLVVLHGGWGYEVYPFTEAIEALSPSFRVIVPDRTGYGRSGRLSALTADFHDRAAAETFALLNALAIDSPVLWGHSDGAVIAVKMALREPAALRGIILEALHLRRRKPSSNAFFEAMARSPDALGERVRQVLAREHGEDYWHTILRLNGLAWLAIAADPDADLYGGRLGALAVPTAIVHGRRDPRTEPGELEAIVQSLPAAWVTILEEGGHSPHSERLTSGATIDAVRKFLTGLPARKSTLRA